MERREVIVTSLAGVIIHRYCYRPKERLSSIQINVARNLSRLEGRRVSSSDVILQHPTSDKPYPNHLLSEIRVREVHTPPKWLVIGDILNTEAIFTVELTCVRRARICSQCKQAGSTVLNQPLLRCSGCLITWYCDRRCELKHWRRSHRHVCPRLDLYVD